MLSIFESVDAGLLLLVPRLAFLTFPPFFNVCLDEDLLWDTAMKRFERDYSVIDLMESSGIYTEDGNRVGTIALLSLNTIASEVIVSSSTKDF